MLYRQILVPKQSETPAVASSHQSNGIQRRLKGMKVVLTGRMMRTREHYKQAIERYGGIVMDKVTPSVDALFIGSTSSKLSSKHQEAIQMQIPIFKESDLTKLILEETKIVQEEQRKKEAARRIAGKQFVITGTLSEKRDFVIERIKSNGGAVASKVTRNVDYLIVGDKGTTTTKYKDAIAYRIPIISENELRQMLS